MDNIKELYTTYNELESTSVNIQFETIISVDQDQQYKQLHQLIFPQLKIGIEIRISIKSQIVPMFYTCMVNVSYMYHTFIIHLCYNYEKQNTI